MTGKRHVSASFQYVVVPFEANVESEARGKTGPHMVQEPEHSSKEIKGEKRRPQLRSLMVKHGCSP